jgi:alpha-D-ribose 1-methylphosphonate 5-triphosphate diphosphatase
MPRPGVHMPLEVALVDNDAQLVASGITTAFHGITCSWEPGLRSMGTTRGLMAGLEALAGSLLADNRIHLRQETYNLAALDEIEDWVRSRRVHLLAFNDHTPDIARKAAKPEQAMKYVERAGVSLDEFRRITAEVHAREAEVPASIERLARAARESGITIAAHDEETPEQRRWYRGLGALVSEFPKNAATAAEARKTDECVVMGAPNVVRGRSHNGNATAADFIADGLCNVLASDYYYPSLLHAPFRLAAAGILPLERAWRLVSADAARAAGLADRGTIEAGRRADLILVDAGNPALPRIVATIVGGRLVHSSRRL